MSPRRSRLLILIALTALLVSPMRVAAEEVADDAPLRWAQLQQRLGIRAYGHSARSDERAPVIGGRAISGRWSGLRMWASGSGFAVGRRTLGYGLQGGAALPLDGGLSVTASYRLTGYSLGSGLDADVADVDDRDGAPFLGLLYQF